MAEKKEEACMTSREVADILGRPHNDIFKKISILIVRKKELQPEFSLANFTIKNSVTRKYPMYRISEKGCEAVLDWLKEYQFYRTVEPKIPELKKEIRNRFHPEESPVSMMQTEGFLLGGRPKSDYADISRLYDQFVTGPGMMNREIEEVTEKCEAFYKVVRKHFPDKGEENEVELAMLDAFSEVEKQGFIYGFKLIDSMLSRRLSAVRA